MCVWVGGGGCRGGLPGDSRHFLLISSLALRDILGVDLSSTHS